ncbi:1394_t:CDS:2, partial [Rhizophagus irregularis]
FCEQQSILKEVIIKAGHIFERYLKFYCECNFIERYWGLAKWETRQLYNYNFSNLLIQVSEVLIGVSITTIHIYDKGLKSRIAEWAVSKYKLHYRLPKNIEIIMEQLEFRAWTCTH